MAHQEYTTAQKLEFFKEKACIEPVQPKLPQRGATVLILPPIKTNEEYQRFDKMLMSKGIYVTQADVDEFFRS